MKKKIIYVATILLLIISLVAPACGFEGDPMLDDLWTRNIYPGTTNTYDVGSLAYQYNNGYFASLFVGGVPVGTGSGDVVGTPPSADHAIARYDGVTGLLIQNSAVTISDAGVIAGGSLSMPTGRSATFIVAASNSAAKGIAQADYACSGAADDVEINAALNALPADGGRVILLEGTYVLADPITIPDDSIALEGQGASSFIDGDGLADTEHGIVVSAKEDVWIRSLSIQTENGGGKDSNCILIEDGSHDFVIDRVIFVESDSDAINIGGTSIWGGLITNCNIVNGDDYGILVDMDGGSSSRYINITNNLIESVGLDGVVFGSTGSHDYNQVINNIFQNTSDDAIQIYDTNGIIVNDNNMHAIGGYGIYADNVNYSEFNNNSTFNTQFAAIYLSSCDSNNIVGNNLDSTLDSDTEDGIFVDGHDNVISSNYINDTERNGVRVVGNDNIVSNNVVIDTHMSGIWLDGRENVVEGNSIEGAGQKAAGTYYGIVLSSTADRCSIIGNTIANDGTDTEDGVHLDDGATEVKVSDNYIYDLMGSGIALTANNDDCQITDNYVQECDDYGVEITAATCDDTTVIGNVLQGNITGQVLDNGTDTRTFTRGVIVGEGTPLVAPGDGNIYAFQSIWTEGSLIGAATPWRAGLWIGEDVVIAIEHSSNCDFDLTGGAFENFLTADDAIFLQADADLTNYILLISGVHAGAAAEIKMFIDTTHVVVEPFGWDGDLTNIDFVVTPHPILIAGNGNRISMNASSIGGVEIDSFDYTNGMLFEVVLNAAIDGTTGIKVSLDANGYSGIEAFEAGYATGDLQPGDHASIIKIDMDDTGASSSDATTEVDFINILTTDEYDLEKHAIHVGQGFDSALTVSGGIEEDPDYGYSVVPDVATDRVTGIGDAGTAFLQASAGDVEIFSSDNDYILIGSDAIFEAVEVILVSGGNQPILAEYYYSTGAGTWATLVVSETTHGFQNSGIITFNAPGTWAKSNATVPAGAAITNAFYVKIVRTRNFLGMPPVEDYFKTFTASSLTDFEIRGDGTIRPVEMADAAAPNNSLYYSTTQNKLVYKDNGGVVNDLY